MTSRPASTSKIEDLYPLTPLQQGILFHCLMHPEEGMYWTQIGFTLHGHLDAALYRQAWRETIARHAVLHTVFLWEKRDRPLQVVLRDSEPAWTELDWENISAAEQEQRLEEYLDAERRQPHHLAQGPLTRCTLIRLAPDRYRFVWSAHHILLDGWSGPLVTNEVMARYDHAVDGQPFVPPRLHAYKGYIEWLLKQRWSDAEAFFRPYLAGVTAPTPLTVDGFADTPGELRPGHDTQQVSLDAHCSERLKTFARAQRIPVNTLVQAAWGILLHRYSGEPDILFGVTLSGRSAPVEGIESMVGLLINTLPMRLHIDPEHTVVEWLREVHRTQTELQQFEHVPLVDTQGWSDIPRGEPFFESLLVFENNSIHIAETDRPSRIVCTDITSKERTNYPLTVAVGTGHDIDIQIAYDTSRFSTSTIRRMLGHFTTVLEALERHATQRIGSLPLLGETEREQLLDTWNQTAAAYPHDRCVHDWFEQQVAATPDAVAVVAPLAEGVEPPIQLTYRELDRRANQVAHHLRRLGAGPESLVAVALDRSVDLVVTVLGVWKADAAYIPFDPSYPKERLAFVAQDAGVAAMVTRTSLLAALPAVDCPIVDLDRDRAVITAELDTPPERRSASHQLAYVIYTSGSTGKPKGVLIEHRSVVNFLQAMRERLDLTAADRLLSVTTLSFDIAGLELYLPLTTGACVILATRAMMTDGALLAREIADCGATVLQATPITWRLLLDSGWREGHGLTILCGGEALPRQLADELLATGATLWNLYGPTETTIWSTLHRVGPSRDRVPIGRPIANTTVYILDQSRSPVPVHVPGELYIGGDGLARGYLNRLELTAERFVADPFRPGARLYRTGDVARYLSDGTIEYVGRLDHQVKLRGFRIELGEIESALNAYPGVGQSVVIVREDQPGVQRLVAYVVGTNVEPGALKTHLRSTLPDYMLPAVFVSLPAFPRLPNGKLDRKALPAPDDATSGVERVGPRSPIEQVLWEIWREVFTLDRLDVHDNFFDLGGHSLLATRMMARIRGVLGIDAPLRVLFEAPTIAELAVRLQLLDPAGQHHQDLPIPRSVGRDSAPLSAAQEGIWFLDRLLGASASYNIPWAVRLYGPLDVVALEHSLQAVVDRHASLRTSFIERDGVPVQLVRDHLPVDVSMISIEDTTPEQREHTIRHLLQEGMRHTFDLTHPPLIRATLLRVDESDHVLLVIVHHIVSDGWSMGILAREVKALYSAFSRGQPSPLAPLPIQFVDYAMWERERSQDPRSHAQLAYWRHRLDGLEPLQLPTDSPRSAHTSLRGGLESFPLPNELVSPLRTLARRENVTLFMVLLAAFKVLLMRWSGQEDIVVGTPSVGRDRTEVEGLIGDFLNTLVLRTDLSGDPEFTQLLQRVHHTTLEAYAHQDIPFDRLVAELSPTRQLNHNPLFDVMINYAEGLYDSFDLPGIATQELYEQLGFAKFAMTLYVEVEEHGIDLHLAYQSDLFSGASITCLLDQYTELLRQIVAAPQKSVGDYSLVTAASRAQVPNPTVAIVASPQQPVTEQILAWARTTPQGIAVSLANRQWSYSELVAHASGLAATLRAQGVQGGDVVAIHGPRGFEFVSAMLAVLLNGSVFLTIDPVLPMQRRRLMMREAGVRALCLIGQPTSGEEIFDHDPGLIVVPVDPTPPAALDPAGSARPLPTLQENDPAYVFFTSGSTGTPKAILGSHKGLAHFLHWQRETFGITPGDRVSQLVGLSFDPLLRDVFLPLVSGATVCIPQERDLAATLRWLQREGVTVVHTTPTLLQSWLLDNRGDIELSALRWLFIAGEPLTDMLVRQWRERFSDSAQLVNLYGPTETTMAKCFYPIPAVPSFGIQPVGIPLPETQALVLRDGSRLCGIGETGEIVLRTPFRSLGYLNLSEENRRRFRKNPFCDDETDLLYYTGDLGRYRPDGVLAVVGRSDDQVKIRGVRVEPGEITATLARHEAVRHCIVIARTNQRGEHDLVAYVVREPEVPVDARQLRAYIGAQLSEAFVPSLYVFLDALPLLPNGKVDRKALPAPAQEVEDTTRVHPRGPIEEALWDIWRDVLKQGGLGVHDNFFERGGHSLLATQVVSRIRDTLQVELPLRTVFETPTIAELAHRIEQLRAEGTRVQEPPIDVLPRNQQSRVSFPTSFSQRRMWLAQQYEPEGTAYNIPLVLRLLGPLNRGALADAVDMLVCRHEAFRTTFSIIDGEPVQVIAPTASSHIQEIDLRAMPESERMAEVMRRLREETMRPFDLEHGPLHRFSLLQISDTDHVMLWLVHHTISDHWSAGIILNELANIYRARNRGEHVTLSPLQIQYADFAVWQRHYLGGTALDSQLAYWRDKLEGLDVLALPIDKPRPARQTFQGSRLFAALLPSTLSALKQLSVSRGVTPFMTLLACFKLLLGRYSEQDDIAVGSPIANRTRVATENVIGTMVNTLVMRTNLSGNPTFGELLTRVREVTLDAYAHQDLPFERLVEELGVGRDASHAPLVQALFNVVNGPMEIPCFDGLAVDSFNFDRGSTQFDISMAIDTEVFNCVTLSYSTDLFEPATAERMLAHYVGLLDQVIADPDKPISAYRIITDAEQQQIVHDWTPAPAYYPSEQRTDELVSAQAQRTPHAVAVSMGDHRLTYAELDACANQLAHSLRRRGVAPDVLVGICLERSVDMVVALLAVMKSGGAYVPLDPAFPQERLDFMAHDAGLALTLTHSKLSAVLPAGLQGKTIFLDQVAAEITTKPVTAPERLGSSRDLAYVLYTSGSTGTPKGVEIPHRALTNLLWSMRAIPGCTEHDTLLSITTLSFDISGVELYLPLIVGGRVELANQQEISDGRLLMEHIAQYQPTVMQATPATWRMLIGAGWNGSDRLRIVCGGEALPDDLADQLLGRCAELWNMYGPTETTIYSTVERIEKRSTRGTTPISIGRPIANTTVAILDRALQPVPVGVPGELFIGGHGLARGYRNRPDLTAERFIATPFPNVLGSTLYRTGDLARWLPDGRIVHLGRLDFQVKIRGFRIELGEIETVLSRHPAIAQVVVAAKNDRDSMQQLVAYVIPHARADEAGRPSAADLRAFLRASLPPYMVPSHFIFLDAFPLTANNKVNVKALPEPAEERMLPSGPQMDPRDRMEVQLTALWRQVLGNETAGIHDNFFDLGGHSLKAVQLLSYVTDITGLHLPLAILFQAPTVAQMAQLLTQSGWKPSWRSLVTIQPSGSATPIFAVPGVGGNVLMFAKLAKLLGSNQPFYGLQSKGLDGNEQPHTSIPEAAAHHIGEIRSMRPHGPYVIAGTCAGGVTAYEIAQQLRAQDEEVTLIILETWPPSPSRRRKISVGASETLRPLWFVAGKVVGYSQMLAGLPLRNWPAFLKSKMRTAGTLFDKGIKEVLADSDFQVEQVVQATWRAVTSYEVRPYAGSLLNVIASNRKVTAGRVDTRVLWDTLAQAPSRRASIPAEDSGRMFVSPHVEQLATVIIDYLATPLRS